MKRTNSRSRTKFSQNAHDPAAFSEAITFFYTRDLAKTVNFYGGILSLVRVVDQGGEI